MSLVIGLVLLGILVGAIAYVVLFAHTFSSNKPTIPPREDER